VHRILSPSSTVWWKFGFPAIWISGIGIATAALWLGAFRGPGNSPPPDWTRWLSLVVWTAASTYLIWFSRRLHYVSLFEDVLTVSSYFNEAAISLAEVSRVTQSYMMNPPTITVHLDRETRLGRRIVFIPVGRRTYLFEHPITTELKELLDQSRKRVLEHNVEAYARHYLRELRSGDAENAFHSLIEADRTIVPLLMEAFGNDSDTGFRTRVLRVIAEFRLTETIPFFAERLQDEFWKTALDCLLMQPSPQAVATLTRARKRRLATERQTAEFQSWLDEAIEQAQDYQHK
jgi:hypothetical protein